MAFYLRIRILKTQSGSVISSLYGHIYALMQYRLNLVVKELKSILALKLYFDEPKKTKKNITGNTCDITI